MASSTKRRNSNFIVVAVVLVVAGLLITAFVVVPSLKGPSSSSSSSGGVVSQSSLSESSSSSSGAAVVSRSSVPASDWLTYHINNTRDGDYASLAEVTSPSVAWNTTVDGPVYAEPLSFNGSVYVATENDTVYSLSGTDGAVEWSHHLGTPANSTRPPFECGGDTPTIAPLVGITSTPAIDPTTDTIYVVGLINDSGYQLFALNTGNGQLRWSQIVDPAGLEYTNQDQRAALTLANGLVYMPFGGFSFVCAGTPHGWVVADALNGNGTQHSYEVPSVGEADIWESQGLSVDSAGFVYVVTGNSFAKGPPFDYGVSVIKMTPDLSVVSYFSPTNYLMLDENDLDLSTTGATLLPGNLIFSIGKEGVGYLLNSSDLGGIGGQLASLAVCPGGAWGGTAFASGVVYVPCADGLYAVAVHTGAHPSLTSLWNYTGFFAGPPIVAGGAVWTFNIYNGTLLALNPSSGAVLARVNLPATGPGFLEHFATPSVGGGLLLFGTTKAVYALNPSP